ncbi:Transcription termination/antitermination protein NusG [bacterium HR34]|nr:Transcription termination/antitermination protein NusG [bacterium HR34]
MPKQQLPKERRWYVIHTYTGYEDVVAQNIMERAEAFGMKDNKIFNAIVPREKKIKIRGGKRKVIEEKIYPGYVLVDMIVDDDSWYVVRNTPNVTGFVGAGVTPLPISEEEFKEFEKRMKSEEPEYNVDFKVGDHVRVVQGPFKGFDGKVSEIDKEKGKVKVLVNMFGRDTPVELDSLQIKKV